MTTAPGRAGHARRAILAIDEGTTTTRAAWVDGTGAVRGWRSRAVDVTHPSPGVVEQDAVQILDRTLEAARASIADAHTAAVELVGLALTQQRLTAVLWDAATGEP